MLHPSDVEKVVAAYGKFKTSSFGRGLVEAKLSYISTPEEIKENEYNLNIPRYVDIFVEEEVDIVKVQTEIETFEKEHVAIQNEIKNI